MTDFRGKGADDRNELGADALAVGDTVGSRFCIEAIFVDDDTLLASDEETGARVRLVPFAAQRIAVMRRALGLEQAYLTTVVDVVERGGSAWLVLADSDRTYERLDELLARRGRLEPTEAVQLVLRVCGALDALHAAGIVHGDATVSNLVVHDDDGLEPLLGFGASALPGCQRPERDDSCLVEADDTWGAGALLFTLLLGDLPPAWGLERGRLVGDLDDAELGGILEQTLCSAEEVRTKGLPVFEAELEDWLVSKLGEGSLPQIALTIPPPLPHYEMVAKRASEAAEAGRKSSRGVIFAGAAVFLGAILGFGATLVIAERNEAVSGSAWPKAEIDSEGVGAPVVDLPVFEVSAKAGELAAKPLALCVAELIPNRVVTETHIAGLCTEVDLAVATGRVGDTSESSEGQFGFRTAEWFRDLGKFAIPTLETLRLGCCAQPPPLRSAVTGCEQLGQAARHLARDVLAGADYAKALSSFEAVSFCLPSRTTPGPVRDLQLAAFGSFAQNIREQ